MKRTRQERIGILERECSYLFCLFLSEKAELKIPDGIRYSFLYLDLSLLGRPSMPEH